MKHLINNKNINLSNPCARTYIHTGILKKIITLSLTAIMLFNSAPFGIFNSKVNAQNENFENEYNFTSVEKDENGNYVDNGNIKSAEWTNEDKSTADIKITYNKLEKDILYLGSLCRGHGLTSTILQSEIDYLATLGNVDAYFSKQAWMCNWQNANLDFTHETFYKYLNKGEVDNSIKNLIDDTENGPSQGMHAYLIDYAEWISEALEQNKKDYGLIIFSFDDFFAPMFMFANITGEWYQQDTDVWKQNDEKIKELEQKMRHVATILKPYYDSGKIVWIIGSSGIIKNDSNHINELNKIYANIPKQTANYIDNNRLVNEENIAYLLNWPNVLSGNLGIAYNLYEQSYLSYPRNVLEYNHSLKSYNKTYIENGITKPFNIIKIINDITGPNLNDLSWSYFAYMTGGVIPSFETVVGARKREYIETFVMSPRPYIWQFALYDPETYLEVTNEDGSFKEIPSLVAEINKDNSGNETAVGIYTDSDKQWNLNTPKTYYGNPEKVGELVGSMLKYHEIKITDTVNEGLVPESLEIQFQNKQDQDGNKDWITFKKIDLENGEGLSETEIPGTVVDLSKNRSYVIKGYRVEKNSDNTYNVCVNVLNKNRETGNAIDIEDNIRLIIHTKADKSFAVENGEENDLTAYGSKDTNKGEATISTTYYKDGNTANAASENIDTIERVKYTSPKLTKTFKIHYISDENGYVTKNNERTEINDEEAIVGHNPNGSEAGNNKPFGLITNQGYRFSHWIADKDVELMDGTKIKAGEAITSDQVKQINVKEEITFKAIHIKTDGATQEEPKQEDTPKEEPKEENKKQPKTGDSITLWISLMLISTLGVIGTIIYFKKKI